jgi:hypothetical protein
MASLYQFIYTGGSNYVWNTPPWLPQLQVTGAPADTNARRFAMLHDGAHYRLYAFRGSTSNTLYQFAWNGSSYQYGFLPHPILKITKIPKDADMNSFATLFDGTHYRLYVRRLGHPKILYEAALLPSMDTFEFGASSHPFIPVTGFPADTDYYRWNMLYDGGSNYRLYFMKLGSNTILYQGAYNPSAGVNGEFQYTYYSIPMLNLVGAPADSNLAQFAMLFGQGKYHFYFQKQ